MSYTIYTKTGVLLDRIDTGNDISDNRAAIRRLRELAGQSCELVIGGGGLRAYTSWAYGRDNSRYLVVYSQWSGSHE
ncbi:Uncharacterised protein [Mycobacteroides abscessus subsp. abscessus]|uniref:hypothetical protein n=1 Tax=Mycobacteroides abscessus TaxID=36809 RepID=UPI0009A90A39|nr:hypothetical protein [Mycobacteroides abscessus]SKO36173.1 Uncharacterised protein [Mycobacteroides abscessus subsp. abscessus]